MINKKPYIIGISGGSCSGKTTLINKIVQNLRDINVTVILQDSYYNDNQGIPFEKRETLNYDHPDAFDSDLLVQHINQLSEGEKIEMPQYDYITHSRKPEVTLIHPSPIILMEGLFIFSDQKLRDKIDVKIFLEIDNDIRFIRRLQRDMQERKRRMESIIHQYLTTVKPMHHSFVQPTKKLADIVISKENQFISIKIITKLIRQVVFEMDQSELKNKK